MTLFTSVMQAQVGIGTPTPEAALDIVSSNNGLLLPRIGLTSATDATTVVNQITANALVNGTTIYNTATSGTSPNNVTPGYYYWNTNRWERINNGTKSEAVSSSITTEPNVVIYNSTASALTSAGTNNTVTSFDNITQTKNLSVTGFSGITDNVTCNVELGNCWGVDVDLYLQSPTGQIIELSTDNGPAASITSFNVVFSDAGIDNITSWTAGNLTGTYRPEGTLAPDGLTPTITTMSGFNGFSPNGTWTLHVRDDEAIINLNYISFTLSISTRSTAQTYRLLGEVPIIYKQGNNIVLNTSYTANSLTDEGVITALTSTSTSVPPATTPADLSAYIAHSYASASPKQGKGNYWLSSRNQAISTGFVDGETRYYQLWVKGNIETPLASNEQWSITPLQLQK